MGGITKNSFRSKQDWSEFLKGLAGMVGNPSGMGRIGETFCRSVQDWTEFLSKWAKLVTIPSGRSQIGNRVGVIDQSSFRNGQDYDRLAGLVTLPAGVGGITQNSFGNRQDWSEFLQGQLGVEF